MLIFTPFLLELESQSYLFTSLTPKFSFLVYSHYSGYGVIISFFSKRYDDEVIQGLIIGGSPERYDSNVVFTIRQGRTGPSS